MSERRPRVPKALPIMAIVLSIAGLILAAVIPAAFTQQQLADNILLNAVPFVIVFVGILLCFITLIWLVALRYNDRISAARYRRVERWLIAGIVLGVIGMFQPWLFQAYQIGFLVLLGSTLGFIVWSHVVPAGAHPVEVGNVSVGEVEPHEAGR